MMVLLSHLPALDRVWGGSTVRIFGRSPSDITLGMGYYGVALFFVISGFLITSGTLRRHQRLEQIDCSAFWWMRFSRIMPMLLASLCAMGLFHLLGVARFTFEKDSHLWTNVSAALCFRFDEQMGAYPNQVPWNPLWSLSIEEIFYLVFPFICLALNGRGAAVWVFLAAMATAVYVRFSGRSSGYHPLGCLDLLSLGCMTALLRPDQLRERLSNRGATRLGLGLGVAGLGIIAIFTLYQHPIPRIEWSCLPVGLGISLALVASQLLDVPSRIRPLLLPISILGTASYEIYLVHMPLHVLLSSELEQNSPLLVGLVIGCGVLAHESFSEPMNRALRELGRDGLSHDLRLRLHRRWALLSLLALSAIGGSAWYGVQVSKPVVWSVSISSFADLPEGSTEPIAYVGREGQADLFFMRHLGSGRVALGVDHWGGAGTETEPLQMEKLVGSRLSLAVGRTGVQVRDGNKILLWSKDPAYSQGPLHVGINDIHFTNTLPKATSRIVLH